jgi:hypothetical protein
MNRLLVAPRPVWIRSYTWLARTVPQIETGDEMWEALIRRHRLEAQQFRLQTGQRDYYSCPPYPFRGRPPS